MVGNSTVLYRSAFSTSFAKSFYSRQELRRWLHLLGSQSTRLWAAMNTSCSRIQHSTFGCRRKSWASHFLRHEEHWCGSLGLGYLDDFSGDHFLNLSFSKVPLTAPCTIWCLMDGILVRRFQLNGTATLICSKRSSYTVSNYSNISRNLCRYFPVFFGYLHVFSAVGSGRMFISWSDWSASIRVSFPGLGFLVSQDCVCVTWSVTIFQWITNILFNSTLWWSRYKSKLSFFTEFCRYLIEVRYKDVKRPLWNKLNDAIGGDHSSSWTFLPDTNGRDTQQLMNWRACVLDLHCKRRIQYSLGDGDRCWRIRVRFLLWFSVFWWWDRLVMRVEYCDRRWMTWNHLVSPREECLYVPAYEWRSQK